MGYNILCYSFSQKSDADSVTNDCRAAFGLPAQTAARPDGKYQVEVTGISAESRAYAISAVMSQAKYNTVSGSTLRSYTYSTQNDANLWKNNLQTACGVTATVSAKSGGYQISLSSSNAAAIGRILGKALYNEVKKEAAGSKTLPLRNNYSWNQRHTAVTSAINGSKAGCLYCCALSIANLYGSKAYTPQEDMNGDLYWDAGGWTGRMPVGSKAFVKGTESYSLSGIKAQIDAGRYVIVKMYDTRTGYDHYVVAYGYTNNAASEDDILVIDSYVKGSNGPNTTQQEGCLISLAQSYTNNNKNRYVELRYTGTN